MYNTHPLYTATHYYICYDWIPHSRATLRQLCGRRMPNHVTSINHWHLEPEAVDQSVIDCTELESITITWLINIWLSRYVYMVSLGYRRLVFYYTYTGVRNLPCSLFDPWPVCQVSVSVRMHTVFCSGLDTYLHYRLEEDRLLSQVMIQGGGHGIN